MTHTSTHAHEVYRTGFYPSGWDFEVRSLLGKASRGGTTPGEVLATIADITPGDRVAWFRAWRALGERTAADAASSRDAGNRASACRAFLRAANYLAVAVDAIDGSGAEDQLTQLFAAHRQAWDGFVANTVWPVERIDIPYEGSTMPAWLFRPSTSAEPRRTFVMVNGSDGSLSGLWCSGAEAALERGWNVLMFDGPGQQSMLFERVVYARPDWEAVLGPVVDDLVTRPEVDAARLAVYGISQAGFWVPRALAFEHRFVAAVVDGGVVDVREAWMRNLPAALRRLYERGDVESFDRDMEIGFRMPGGAGLRRLWAFRARPFGVAAGYAAVLDEVKGYTLDGLTDRISTPLLVTDPDDDEFFPGQSQRLAELVPGAERMPFTASEGASGHCEPLARDLVERRIFDWLDARVPACSAGVVAR